jgi:hypothetical protein
MKENPLIPMRRPPLPCKGPKTENTKDNRLTIYLVDVMSANHRHGIPLGAETRFRKINQTKFP